MNRPPHGFCVPVEYRRCLDGDTIEVSIFGGETVSHVRLLDCWCPEMSEPGGAEAKRYAEKLLAMCRRPSVMVPFNGENLLTAITSMGRLLGYLFLSDTETLNEKLVAAGHATQSKPKKGQPK